MPSSQSTHLTPTSDATTTTPVQSGTASNPPPKCFTLDNPSLP